MDAALHHSKNHGSCCVAQRRSIWRGMRSPKYALVVFSAIALTTGTWFAISSLRRSARNAQEQQFRQSPRRWGQPYPFLQIATPAEPISLFDPDFFGHSAVDHVCKKHDVSEGCCGEMKDVVSDLRWTIVFDGVVAFVIGLSIVLVAFTIGRKVKPRRPSYWKNAHFWWFFSDDFEDDVDVTYQLKDTMQELLDLTTDPRKMGKGRDGAWATHRGFKVVKVERVENGPLWSAYKRAKRQVRRVQDSLDTMQDANERANAEETYALMNTAHRKWQSRGGLGSFIDTLKLDRTRNERLLFHACPREGARDPKTGAVKFLTMEGSPQYCVKTCGFDDRLGSTHGMLGSGTYFADMASKADCYGGMYNEIGGPNGTVGEVASMFVSRVTLGCQYKSEQSLEGLRRPPCLAGHFDLNLGWGEAAKIGKPWGEKGLPLQLCDHCRYDSVMSDLTVDGGRKLYREYVLYEKVAYPEFCVTYERIAGT